MKRVSIPIETTELCHYGCGCVAKFKNGSGNLMCQPGSTKCPAVKHRNSEKAKLSYVNGRSKSDFGGKRGWAKGKRHVEFGIPGSGQFKAALISERSHRCECCGNTLWMDKNIPLELEHTDGNRKNNTRENLKLLCPNCHAQTPTWRRSSNPVGFRKKRYSDEIMIAAIQESENINQVLSKLDLRYGSVPTIVKIMVDNRITFKSMPS